MRIKLSVAAGAFRSLVVEPWGEEFDIRSKAVEIVLTPSDPAADCEIGLDCTEEGFLRFDNPTGFCPMVLIDGREDERPAFTLV